MNLQGRDLQKGLTGEDVKLLQSELRQLHLEIPDEEFNRSYFGDGTERAVLLFQRLHNIAPLKGVVNENTARQINAEVDKLNPPPPQPTGYVVRGQVRTSNGKPVASIPVVAYDKDLRSEQFLGETRTDQEGRYELRYSAQAFDLAEVGSADLRISVHNTEGREIATSPIYFNAPPEAVIDVAIGGEYRGPSEYEQLTDALRPALQGLAIADLTEDEEHQDISFLVGETGREPRHIALLILAHRLAQKTGLDASVFYGFGRQGLPTNLRELLVQSPEVQQLALQTAVSTNIIPELSEKEITAILAQLKELIVAQAFDQPADNTRATLVSMLRFTLRDKETQAKFITQYVNHQGPIQDFWRGLRQQPEFRGHVNDLQFTMQLGALTMKHLPLMETIHQMRQVGQVQAVRDLVQFDATDWKKILRQSAISVPADVEGKDTDERIHHYAQLITQRIERAFPSAFIVARVAKDELPARDEMVQFFSKNEKFELTTTPFETYLRDNPKALDGINNQQTVRTQIKAIQRLYKVAPQYGQVSVLLKNQIHSSFQLAQIGHTQLNWHLGSELGGDYAVNQIVYNSKRSAALAVDMKYAFGRANDFAIGKAIETFETDGLPDWQTMFGSLEMCECQHCQSVYSPAAYLVDLLNFLSYRWIVASTKHNADGIITSVTPKKILDEGKWRNKSVADALLERRPDISDIELTCENTNTPLPYVDLVCEILENAVAPLITFTPFALGAGSKTDLDNRTFSAGLKSAFTPSLSDDAVITVKKAGKWWTIDEPAFTYTIRNESDGINDNINVVARSLQTKGTAQELAANPQYMNADAYEHLRNSSYPWEMPFDLWMEEIRNYLGHLGIRRDEVMEVFLPGDRKSLLETFDIAIEYLQLTSKEADLITGKTTSDDDIGNTGTKGPWNLWGFKESSLSLTASIPNPANRVEWLISGNWIDVIASRVDVFLQQSGLTYKEMLDIISTSFVTSAGTNPISIISTKTYTDQNGNVSVMEDSCQTEFLKLEGLVEEAALRIQRFVRLWRKLGWSIRELDLAVRVFGGDLNEECLRKLSHLMRINTMFSIPINRLLGFWGDIDTDRYVDHQASGQPSRPSLYEQLFRNRKVSNPVDVAFKEDPKNLDSNLKLTDHVFTITAGLKISASDLKLLLDNLSGLTDSLSLPNLSLLHREATLARSLGLSIRDYLSVRELSAINVFASTVDTVLFVERVNRLSNSNYTLDELNYLLRHKFNVTSGIAPSEESIAMLLDELRNELQKIAVENTFIESLEEPDQNTHDADGTLTKKKLGLLNWDTSLIEQTVTLLNDTIVFETFLAVAPNQLLNDEGQYDAALNNKPNPFFVPAGLNEVVSYDNATQKLKLSRRLIPIEWEMLSAVSADGDYQNALSSLRQSQDKLQGTISYVNDRQVLRFVGAMTTVRRDHLLTVSPDASYQQAIQNLFNAPRDFARRNLASFEKANFSTKLIALPKISVPPSLKNKIYYDKTQQSLHFIGAMTVAERETLRQANEPDFNAAIDDLYAQADQPIANAQIVFLTAGDVGTLFDTWKNIDGTYNTPESRFSYVLKKLMGYLRPTMSRQLVIQKLADSLHLEATLATNLIGNYLQEPGTVNALIEVFLDKIFVESNVNVKPDRNALPQLFDMYVLLHKSALIINKSKVTAKQLDWLYRWRSITDPTYNWLGFEDLPLSITNPPPAIYEEFIRRWERLMTLFELRDDLPRGETLLDSVFKQARTTGINPDEVLKALSDGLKWDLEDLNTLYNGGGFNYAATFPQVWQDEAALTRLVACFRLLKKSGMSARFCINLSYNSNLDKSETARTIARSVRRAVRAKYDEEEWSEIAKPLRDRLREKQRAALVAYLVKHPATINGKPGWRDANDLYGQFLIDVEMSPCQMTSRLKQATLSIQLFVQRCQMNLEPESPIDLATDDEWVQWEVRKTYRVDEASKKIFVDTESYVFPELRDDKSPIYREFESELMQGDLTEEIAEKAIINYLEKFSSVARLEIVGMYRQKEDHTNILHVFGRTLIGSPKEYYYRQWVDESYWTAWEKVDLDINSDHIVPVVWNRRLYLFWLIITKAGPEITAPTQVSNGMTLNPPKEYWSIQLAWSEKKHSKWAPKMVSMIDDPSERLPKFIQTFEKEVTATSGTTKTSTAQKTQEELATSNISLQVTLLPDEQSLKVTLYATALVKKTITTIETTDINPLDLNNFFDLGIISFLTNADSKEEINTNHYSISFIFVCPDTEPYRENGAAESPVYKPTFTLLQNTSIASLSLFVYTFPLYLPVPQDKAAFGQSIPYTLFFPQDGTRLDKQNHPFFYADDLKSFFVTKDYVLVPFTPEPSDPDTIHLPDEPVLKPDLGVGDPVTQIAVNGLELNSSKYSFGVNSTLQAKFVSNTGMSAPLINFSKRPTWLSSTGSFLVKGPAGASFEVESANSQIKEDSVADNYGYLKSVPVYKFQPFYHNYVGDFIARVKRSGLAGLFNRDAQLQKNTPSWFKNRYQPTDVIATDYPKEEVDFSDGGAYSLYNWELFFHAPLLIADRLYKNQRFEASLKYLRYIFDPTNMSGTQTPQRYWITKPFYQKTTDKYKETIKDMLWKMANGVGHQSKELEEYRQQVEDWRKAPFNVHRLARQRTLVYQKAVMLKFSQVCIGRADQLYRRGDAMQSFEMISEAIQWYIFAAILWGKKPEEIPPRAVPEVQTYKTIKSRLEKDSFNTFARIEDFIPPSAPSASTTIDTISSLSTPLMLYFCVPKNEKILENWDIIADRLFKIRHCMNIEGVERQLPLFEAPIDPAMLVKAAAAGLDIGSALSEMTAPLPHYRFNVWSQKASEICAEVKSIGAALSEALEKKDSEHLARVRAEQETKIINLTKAVKELNLDQAKQNKAAHLLGREVAVESYLHFDALAGNQSAASPKIGEAIAALPTSPLASVIDNDGVKIIGHEKEELENQESANSYREKAAWGEKAANVSHLIPDAEISAFPLGTGGSVRFGGPGLGAAGSAIATYYHHKSSSDSYTASNNARMGNFVLRGHDWAHQRNVQAKTIMHQDKLLAPLESHIQIAQKEKEVHERQLEHAAQIEEILATQFAREEFQMWKIGKCSELYFPAYQLAYDAAKKAERALCYELGLTDANYIQFGYWDNLHQGLLSGEQLYQDIKRMETAYLDQNKRDYEITKHISLALVDPLALLLLRESGECHLDLPELLFDLDHPGHYFRRIKSLSLTIPCVAGPYTTINCKLTLLSNSLRTSTRHTGQYIRKEEDEDARFTDNFAPLQSIAASAAQGESGIFEVNFKDERYLPFEGAGAICRLRFELPLESNRFDRSTISDVVLHMKYTARDGGTNLKAAALSSLPSKGINLFTVRQNFPTEWNRFLSASSGATYSTLTLPLDAEHFPYHRADKKLMIDSIEIFTKVNAKYEQTYNDSNLSMTLKDGVTAPTPETVPDDALKANPWKGLLKMRKDINQPAGTFTLNAWIDDGKAIENKALEDIFIICQYSLK